MWQRAAIVLFSGRRKVAEEFRLSQQNSKCVSGKLSGFPAVRNSAPRQLPCPVRPLRPPDPTSVAPDEKATGSPCRDGPGRQVKTFYILSQPAHLLSVLHPGGIFFVGRTIAAGGALQCVSSFSFNETVTEEDEEWARPSI